MRVSVVIPAYRAEPFLAETLKSVHAQTLQPHEIIVVDDASGDATAEIGRAGGARVVVLERNSGVSVARNEGVRNTSGDVIALLDADDHWDPRHLEVLSGLLHRHPGAAVAFGRARLYGDLDMLTRICIPEDTTCDAFLASARVNLAQPSASLIRREAFDGVGGFDADYRYAEDFDFWLRLAQLFPFVNTYEVTSFYRIDAAGKARRKGADREWQCRSRHRMWQNLGESTVAERRTQLERIMLEEWQEHLQNAWYDADRATFERILGVAELVPGSASAAEHWRQRRRWFWARRAWNELPEQLRSRLKRRPGEASHSHV